MTDTRTGIDPELTLGALVNQQPGSARVLESFGLDYCCGGRQSLLDACRTRGVAVEDVAAALDHIGPEISPDWVAMTPAALVDHLESTHHRYLHAELPRLDALAEKVAAAHGGRHPELLDVLADVKDLRDDLEPHLFKEEKVLFPMIRELCAADAAVTFHCGTLGNPISMMLIEHDRAGSLLEQLRERTDGYAVPADGCASYQALYDGLAELETDTHLHVHKENNLLFPAVLELESRISER
ncbi:MAG: iron-sulfur cluster repair di-iron protein [Microthrixaceae bacterium]